MPFGAELTSGGVRFAIWAPAARYADVHVDRVTLPMASRANGFFERVVAEARAGSRYSFSFDRDTLRVPDPASRRNPEDVHAPSEVVDPSAFSWSDGNWRGRPWHEAVIYELHVGTFTDVGTFAAAAERLDYLRDLGITAIELMPLADTPGKRNWGYDGVLPFAPEHGYGAPDDLKRFIQSAHERELMVLLDVVYNHFGPEGNYLHLYAPQFFTSKHHTPWGNAINFDDVGSEFVRAFFIHNALYWIEEYNFDGLRLDAVHAILDDSEPDFLTELAAVVSSRVPDRPVHLVLENDNNVSRYLRRDITGRPTAYTAQWNDDFHHALWALMTGDRVVHYQDYNRPAEQLLRCLTSGFAYQGEHSPFRGRPRGEPTSGLPPEAFVNFLQNHDQIGNRPDGKRLWMLLEESQVAAAETLLLLLPTPILLFMGDEFHATARFPFFCDFEGELATAIREGRRKDFSHLLAGVETPDPNDPREHGSAVLDWSERDKRPHTVALDRYRRLLEIRRRELQPRLPARADGGVLIGPAALVAAWRLAGGSLLKLSANLRSQPQRCAPLAGRLLAATEELPDGAVELPPWFVSWRLE
jgi:malto-oligosyltrehalose trehalohydrolase